MVAGYRLSRERSCRAKAGHAVASSRRPSSGRSSIVNSRLATVWAPGRDGPRSHGIVGRSPRCAHRAISRGILLVLAQDFRKVDVVSQKRAASEVVHEGVSGDHSPPARRDRTQAVVVILEAPDAETVRRATPMSSTTARRISRQNPIRRRVSSTCRHGLASLPGETIQTG